MANVQYTATTTATQAIDTFALATVKAIEYRIHAVDNNDESLSVVDVTHNGISISEVQESTSVGNNQPAEFTTSIINANTGQINVAPSSAPTTYTITRIDTTANLYAEHTVSGKLIKHTEGIGIYFTGSANNMSVRASNAYFGNSSQFITADVLGPTMIGDELFDSNNFVSHNGSTLVSNGNYSEISLSGQNRSSHNIEIATTVGEKYRVQANAFYTFTPVQGPTTTVDSGARIAVGTAAGLTDITYTQITKTEAQYNVDFVATGNSAFVSIGHGALGTTVSAQSISIKEVAPFPTYNQSNGTFYFKWNAVAADSNVAVMNSNRVYVDSSNNVYINDVNVGAQQATNKLSYTYDGTTVQHSFNGAAVVSTAQVYYSNVSSCSLVTTTPEEMSYVPTIISNTNLTGLTS